MSEVVAQQSPSAGKQGQHSQPQPQLKPVVEYVPFIRKIAMRLARRLPSHVRLEDLMGAGVVGLMEAMKRYDPTRMRSFESFAEFRVRGAMLDELRSRDLMARDARMESKRIERAVAELRNELGEEPDDEHVAARMGMAVEELRARLSKLAPVRVLSIDDISSAGQMSAGGESPFDSFARQELLGRLKEAILQLSKRQQQVLQLYYREELTLKEVGQVLGVTESRVCQIVSEIGVRLRSMLTEREPDGKDENDG